MDKAALERLFSEAWNHHRNGALEEAETRCDAILRVLPDTPEALHLKGLLAAQQGRHGEAEAAWRRMIARSPHSDGTRGNLATLLMRLGRADEAIALYDELIALRPDHANAHHARARILHVIGRIAEALPDYDRAVALDDMNRIASYERGNALMMLGRAQDAFWSYERASGLPEADYGAGNALQAQSQFDQAIKWYDGALARRPAFAEAWSSRGNALQALDRLDEALANHDRAVALKPDSADMQFNRANALLSLGRTDEALAGYDQALALKPDHARALASRGTTLRDLGRLEEAVASYDRALALMPGHADAWSNRGTALQALLRLDEALASYARAIELRFEHVDAHWNRATALLLAGDFKRGWPEFEWRWRTQAKGLPGSWLGEAPLEGRSIMLRSEQGLGDTIQFARYAPMVKALGARVILSVQAPLVRLMKSLDDDIEVIATRDVEADLDCPLMSLPLAFGTTLDTVPAPPRYLAADATAVQSWRARLPGKRRIGLVWSGNPDHRNDRNRSLPLDALAPLFDIEARWVALQKDMPARDVETLQRLKLMRVADELGDFADTAALIDALDLVISVDTSVAHLAGALGKPVWILLPFSPDWRWMTGRDDSPWYPGARLFRQSAPGDWAGVIERLRRELGGAS